MSSCFKYLQINGYMCRGKKLYSKNSIATVYKEMAKWEKRQSHIVVVLKYMKYFDRDLPTTQPSQIQHAKQQASNHVT